MGAFAVLTAVLAVTLAFPFSQIELQQWKDFKLAYGKEYANEAEEKMRMEIFAKNLREFAKHNEKYDAGLVSYKKGVTQFSDLTVEEFMDLFPPMNVTGVFENGIRFVPPANMQVPDSIDWRERGAVTDVKNQQECGSCYTFSATGALEAQFFLKNGNLVPLSEQNLVDCSIEFGNKGCRGGLPVNAFRYVQHNGGIDTEESYPYENRVGECHYDPQHSAGTVSGYISVAPGDESQLQAAVGTAGPVSVGINAALLRSYHGGVLDDPNCDPRDLGHAVLVVGYGSENGKDYWIVKNSWGPQWGENGYVRMSRNKNNQCGIASGAVYPTV